MHKKDQIVVYRFNVCRVEEILPKYRNDEDYYRLNGLFDTSLVIYAPIKMADMHIRPVISSAKAAKLLKDIAQYDEISTESGAVQRVCDDHVQTGTHKELLQVIKTYHQQRQAKLKPAHQWNERDKTALHHAEKVLYLELGAALGRTSDSVRQTVYEQSLVPAVI